MVVKLFFLFFSFSALLTPPLCVSALYCLLFPSNRRLGYIIWHKRFKWHARSTTHAPEKMSPNIFLFMPVLSLRSGSQTSSDMGSPRCGTLFFFFHIGQNFFIRHEFSNGFFDCIYRDRRLSIFCVLSIKRNNAISLCPTMCVWPWKTNEIGKREIPKHARIRDWETSSKSVELLACLDVSRYSSIGVRYVTQKQLYTLLSASLYVYIPRSNCLLHNSCSIRLLWRESRLIEPETHRLSLFLLK